MTAIIGTDVKRRVSYKKKVEKDFLRQRDMMDIYDTWTGDYRDYDEIKKFDINYDLFNGRLDVDLYDDPSCINVEGEKVKFEFGKPVHYPLTSQIANAIHGEMINRPFKPMAKDLGHFGQTLRAKKWNSMMREFIDQSVIIPMRDQITAAFLQKQQIADASALTPEQIQQIQQEIEGRVASKTPEEIVDFMENDFQTPTQRQAQQLLDYFVANKDIRHKHTEGFKHAIITGMEVYAIGDSHGEPTMDLVNPKYFTWGGSQNTEWIQDGNWARYEEWLTFEEVTQRYSEELGHSDWKELEGFAEPVGGIPGVGDPTRDKVQERTMYELSMEESDIAKKHGDINYKTRAGQESMKSLYDDVIKKYGGIHGESFAKYGVRVAHFVWRDKRLMYRVTRISEGKEVKTWEDEHYTKQPGDIKVKKIWVDEIWEGTKIGATGTHDIYVRIRPIPGMYPSLFNPFGLKLPYVGRRYNSHMNNARNVSLIDLGKSWQKEFDTTMAKVKHQLATDIGNVFMMSLSLKPDNWTWQDWFNTMVNGKIMMTNVHKHGLNNMDPAMMRQITLSNSGDIANNIQLLDYFKNNLVTAMNFNNARIGNIGQYATSATTLQNQTASYNQTESYFETHRLIVEKALGQFMNRARVVYKNNPKTNFILDDVSRTELEIGPDFWYDEWAISFSTSSEDIKAVEDLKARSLEFIQNQMSFSGVLALSLAKTPSDIIDIMKKEDKKREQAQQQAQAQQQQQMEAQIQAQAAEAQAEREFKMQMEMSKQQSQEKRTMIDVDKFRLQNDVDRNNQADTIQKALIDGEIKKSIEDAKLAMKERELELKYGNLDKKMKLETKKQEDLNDNSKEGSGGKTPNPFTGTK